MVAAFVWLHLPPLGSFLFGLKSGADWTASKAPPHVYSLRFRKAHDEL